MESLWVKLTLAADNSRSTFLFLFSLTPHHKPARYLLLSPHTGTRGRQDSLQSQTPLAPRPSVVPVLLCPAPAAFQKALRRGLQEGSLLLWFPPGDPEGTQPRPQASGESQSSGPQCPYVKNGDYGHHYYHT